MSNILKTYQKSVEKAQAELALATTIVGNLPFCVEPSELNTFGYCAEATIKFDKVENLEELYATLPGVPTVALMGFSNTVKPASMMREEEKTYAHQIPVHPFHITKEGKSWWTVIEGHLVKVVAITEDVLPDLVVPLTAIAVRAGGYSTHAFTSTPKQVTLKPVEVVNGIPQFKAIIDWFYEFFSSHGQLPHENSQECSVIRDRLFAACQQATGLDIQSLGMNSRRRDTVEVRIYALTDESVEPSYSAGKDHSTGRPRMFYDFSVSTLSNKTLLIQEIPLEVEQEL